MINDITILPTPDLSGFAPMIGTAISMLGMLIIVAGSAVRMMA